jgi:hypothetical protein
VRYSGKTSECKGKPVRALELHYLGMFPEPTGNSLLPRGGLGLLGRRSCIRATVKIKLHALEGSSSCCTLAGTLKLDVLDLDR